MDESVKIGLIGTGTSLVIAGSKMIEGVSISSCNELLIGGGVLLVSGTVIIVTGGYLLIKQVVDAACSKLLKALGKQ